MTKTDRESGNGNGPREQKLAFYHANSTGNGAALQLEPRLNRRDGDRYNCFFLEMAQQKTVAGRDGDRKIHATFDWENKMTVRLDFADTCELLAVLEGRQERAGGQRNGLFHDNGQASTVIGFQKNTDKTGYFLSLSRKGKDGGQPVRLHINLSEVEAIGLRCVFQTGLFFITFHAHLFAGTGTRAPTGREEGAPRAAG